MRIPMLLPLLAAAPALATPVNTASVVAYAAAPSGGGFIEAYPATAYSLTGGYVSQTTSLPGVTSFGRAQADPWAVRVGVDVSVAPNALAWVSTGSGFNINQRITGAPGSTATISYTFRVDGTFQAGPAGNYAGGPLLPQRLGVYFLAFNGSVAGARFVPATGGLPRAADDLIVDATNGSVSFWQPFGSPYRTDTLTDDIVPGTFTYTCIGLEPGCADATSIDQLVTISWDQPVDADYFVTLAAFGVGNGVIDFWNTAKLVSIGLDPAYTLISDDGGALRRRPDGSYGLAAVPEPASWALMIAGFGAVGLALRRRRMAAA